MPPTFKCPSCSQKLTQISYEQAQSDDGEDRTKVVATCDNADCDVLSVEIELPMIL
jgi:hypothetical protein